MYVPEFRTNLVSVPCVTKNGYSVIFNDNSAVIKRRNDTTVLTAQKKNDLYVIELSSEQHSMLVAKEDDRMTRWHQKLDHLNYNDVKKMHNTEMVEGMQMTQNAIKIESRCEACDLSKVHQLPFSKSKNTEKDILGLIHTDICELMRASSLRGARYFAHLSTIKPGTQN